MQDNLKRRIMDEMVVDYSSALEKNFNMAKRFIRITKDGKVDILVKDKLVVRDNIALYLIGKLYAREVGLAVNDEVNNEELLNELGIPTGSLLPGIKELRDKNIIRTTKREGLSYHVILPNMVEKKLREIDKKTEGGGRSEDG